MNRFHPESISPMTFRMKRLLLWKETRDWPFFLFLSYNAPHTPLEAIEKYLNRFPGIEDTKRKTYAMVSAIDDGVGRVLAELRKYGLEENTIVAFLSDNGGPTTKNASTNAPLRGGKGDAWEGGFRIPFAIQWKGKLPAVQAMKIRLVLWIWEQPL